MHVGECVGRVVVRLVLGLLALGRQHQVRSFHLLHGGLRLHLTEVGLAGTDVRDFYVVDAKYVVNPNLKVGAAWYGVFADTPSEDAAPASANIADFRDTRYNTIALNAEAKFGAAVIDGFVATQFGDTADRNLTAYAANVGAKVKVGPGTLKTQFLYTSGEDEENGNNNSWQSVVTRKKASENTFYASGMRILMRDPTATAGTDRAVVSTSSNAGRGILGGFVGYDADITQKVFANANAGFMSTANEGGKDYIGTELNAEVGYRISPNLTASLVGAYVWLNDSGAPVLNPVVVEARQGHQDPWTTRMMLNFTF